MTSRMPQRLITAAQRQRIACILRAAGQWDERHSIFGVASLTQVTFDAASAWLDQHAPSASSASSADRTRQPKRRRPRPALGTLRPASAAQRAYLLDLIAQSDRPECEVAEWLHDKYGIRDVAREALDSRLAARVIQALRGRAAGLAAQRKKQDPQMTQITQMKSNLCSSVKSVDASASSTEARG